MRGSFHRDELKDRRFDFILANPPFNISDWGGERLREDARWKYGVPPVGNANYGWLQHILSHLAPNGTAGVVLANGSMSSGQNGENDIREAMVTGDVVDCMIALPLVTSLKGSVTVDWMHRDAARARMRVLVKGILRKYGYPPDLQDAAVQTVLQQAEALSSEWAKAA
jgi:N-6 DNA Methylase/Domain of unknown function (DUF3387)